MLIIKRYIPLWIYLFMKWNRVESDYWPRTFTARSRICCSTFANNDSLMINSPVLSKCCILKTKPRVERNSARDFTYDNSEGFTLPHHCGGIQIRKIWRNGTHRALDVPRPFAFTTESSTLKTISVKTSVSNSSATSSGNDIPVGKSWFSRLSIFRNYNVVKNISKLSFILKV